MRIESGQVLKIFLVGLIAVMLGSLSPSAMASGPIKRSSNGPTSKPSPPAPPPKEEKEIVTEYVYRDTRMIRVPILPPFPIF